MDVVFWSRKARAILILGNVRKVKGLEFKADTFKPFQTQGHSVHTLNKKSWKALFTPKRGPSRVPSPAVCAI